MPSIQMVHVGHTGAYASYIASNHVQTLVAYYSRAPQSLPRLAHMLALQLVLDIHCFCTCKFVQTFFHMKGTAYPTVIYCEKLETRSDTYTCTCTYRIAGNFRGIIFSWIGLFALFRGKKFHGCMQTTPIS